MMSLISVTVCAMALVFGVVFCQGDQSWQYCPPDALRVCRNPAQKCLVGFPIGSCLSYWCCYVNTFGKSECKCKNTDLGSCQNPLQECRRCCVITTIVGETPDHKNS